MKKDDKIHRIFFGMAMDGFHASDLKKVLYRQKHNLLSLPVQLCTTIDDCNRITKSSPISIVDPSQTVEQSLRLMKTCDLALFDLSISHWHYVGCICEMMNAVYLNIPIVGYFRRSALQYRTYIQYYIKWRANTYREIQECIIGALHLTNIY